MKRQKDLLPLMNFFAETLRETLDEWDVSQAEVSRMTGIPSPHLTDMKKSKRRCTPEKRRRLVAVLDRSERDLLRRSEGFVTVNRMSVYSSLTSDHSKSSIQNLPPPPNDRLPRHQSRIPG